MVEDIMTRHLVSMFQYNSERALLVILILFFFVLAIVWCM